MRKNSTVISLAFSIPVAMGVLIMSCCMPANAAEPGYSTLMAPRVRDALVAYDAFHASDICRNRQNILSN